MRDAYVRHIGAVADFCYRRAWLTLVCALLISAACVGYGWTHMAISTDANALLSDKLPFTRSQQKLTQAFPDSTDAIVLILDGDSSDIADDAAARLEDWLKQHPDTIEHIYSPATDRFFLKNGLLYMDLDELDDLTARLTRMQPVLGNLAKHPTLPGLSKLIGEALDEGEAASDNKAALARLFDAVGHAVDAAKQGHAFIFPWHEVMTGNSSAETRRRIIEIAPHMNEDDIQPAEQAIDLINRGVHALGLDADHGVRLRMTGEAVLDYEQLQGAMRASGLATGLAAVLILLLLFVALKDARLVFAVTLTLTMSLLWTGAFALFATSPLNLISISFAVLFIGMGVDFGIQFSVRCLHELADGVLPAHVIRRTAHGLGAALGLSALAAAASFFSFIPTDYNGLADLGVIAGTGMFIALAATFTVLPALMRLMRRPGIGAPATAPSTALPATKPAHSSMATWISSHARAITGAAVALILISLAPTLLLQFDFNPLHLLDERNPAFQAFQSLAKESKASPYAVDIIRDDLATADRLAAKIDKLNSVARTLTLSSLIPDQQQEKLDLLADLAMVMPPFTLQVRDAPPSPPKKITAALKALQQKLLSYSQQSDNSALTPHAAALAEQLADFLRHNGNNATALRRLDHNITAGLSRRIRMLATALDAEKITPTSLPESLKKRFLNGNGVAHIQVFSKLDLDQPGNMQRFVRQIQMLAPDAAGDPVMMVEGGAVVAHAFRQASLLAFGFVSMLLMLSLGGLRDSLGVLIPLLLAALLTAAAMQIGGLTLNLANIIVLPLLAGLGVSYGIYLALGQREAGLNGLFRSATPRAVLFSALTTLCSFGSMAISGDAAMMMLGKTLTIALLAVLLCVLIVQPALICLISHKPETQRCAE